MDLTPFCRACEDDGFRFDDESGMEVECRDCPVCPCGERLAKHEALDTEEIDMRALAPRDVLHVEGEAWAGECYEQYLDELDGADEPDMGQMVARTAALGAMIAAPWVALFAIAMWVF